MGLNYSINSMGQSASAGRRRIGIPVAQTLATGLPRNSAVSSSSCAARIRGAHSSQAPKRIEFSEATGAIMSWVAFGDLEVCPFRPTDSEEFKSAQRLFEPVCGRPKVRKTERGGLSGLGSPARWRRQRCRPRRGSCLPVARDRASRRSYNPWFAAHARRAHRAPNATRSRAAAPSRCLR
jgi:hypothetical protein